MKSLTDQYRELDEREEMLKRNILSSIASGDVITENYCRVLLQTTRERKRIIGMDFLKQQAASAHNQAKADFVEQASGEVGNPTAK
jgi:hypothetical protein